MVSRYSLSLSSITETVTQRKKDAFSLVVYTIVVIVVFFNSCVSIAFGDTMPNLQNRPEPKTRKPCKPKKSKDQNIWPN